MSSRNYGLVLFAITAIALVGWSPWSSSQSKSPYRPDWPPPPWALFNFHGMNLDLSGGDTSIAPGEKLVVYTVPDNTWLIVTHAEYSIDVWLLERHASVETIKTKMDSVDVFISGDLGNGPLGFTFRPGSEVVVWNTHNQSNRSIAEWHLVGYLVRP